MPPHRIALISHPLCPLVQRAVIALLEKRVAFEQNYVDLSNKPGWFHDVSPLGKTPVLLVGDTAIFESSVILEYLEETQPHALHPPDPLLRAEHRSWMEFGSSMLNDIGGFYNAPNRESLDLKAKALNDKFGRLETCLKDGPYFGGNTFSLVDAVFGPVFRYFDVFDQIGDFGIMMDVPKVIQWRNMLQARPSVANAVRHDYANQLQEFLRRRNSMLSSIMLAP